MHRLPTLTSEGVSWRLPLADHVAVGLAEVLLMDGDSGRADRLALLLRDDPALTLWSVCRAAAFGAATPAGVDQLADWLSAHALAVLRWSGGEAAERSDGVERKRRWAELTAAGVAVASIAAHLAADHTGNEKVDAERAYLCGLLHGANEWLAACGSDVAAENGNSQYSRLPDWLQQVLREVSERLPRDPIARVVRAAVDCAMRRENDPTATVDGLEEHRAHAEVVRRRWMADDGLAASVPSGAAGGILVGLIGKLTRLVQLERGFAAALEQEKLASLKELAYGASHEINNPLANISTRAQTLLRDETDPERRRKLATINSQAFRAHEMIADLMLFAKPPPIRARQVDLIRLIDEVIGELADKSHEQGTTIARGTTALSLVIAADEGHLATALRAMCINSLEALRAGGRIEIDAAEVDGPSSLGEADPWARITVSDDGPGISAEVRRHLFDPYYCGREAGRGLGLGLSKCWRIVTQHGGRIEVESRPGGGATFGVLLPREQPVGVEQDDR